MTRQRDQRTKAGAGPPEVKFGGCRSRCDQLPRPQIRPEIGPVLEGCLMYFVAAVLVVLSGVFYAAGHHELGSYSADVCRYGGAFCDNPLIVLAFAGLAGVWGAFVSIR